MHKLDTSGLNCPLPILKTKQTLSKLAAGEILEVTATDPGSVADFDSFCRATGNVLLEQDHGDGTFRYRIERKA